MFFQTGIMYSHFFKLILSLAVAATLAYFIVGLTGLLAVSCLILLGWLAWHLYQISRLYNWLKNPKLNTLPRARSGVWGDIFDTLLSQAKSRKKRKQKLASALLHLNRLTEALPNGVLLLDAQGRIEWLNRPAAQHLALDLAHDHQAILKNLIRSPEFHAFMQAAPDQQAPDIHMVIHGRSILINRSAFDKDQTLLVTQDLTTVERLNTTRSDFVANVSHELRTPLTVVNGFIETLIDLPDTPREQQQEFLGLMQQESNRMLDLIADLLTLSRLESGQTDEHLQTINFSELIERTAAEGRALSQEQHTFTTDITPDIWLNGIALDLHNAFSNLIFNAVRYTPAGGSIHINLLPEDEHHIRFSVSDTGPGIAAEHLPRLTERFYRVDPGRARQHGGTGLGLAITKHALSKHYAELEIQSQPGSGSTFSAVLETIAKPADSYSE